MGPGTHVEERLLNGVRPLNKSDAAALIHDIEYLLYEDQTKPDKTSIENASLLYKPLMKLGYFFKDLKGYSTGNAKGKYFKLRYLLENEPTFKWINDYKLFWSDGTPVLNVTS